ncbi:MAG TPA: hypothetical protein PKA10_18370 [Selenomonadales bacterium]|nr:hypothetical protein [Selenomonadales bacterium]
MAYEKTTVAGAIELLNKLRDFAAVCGWTVLVETDDLPIDGTATSDGRRLVIKSPDETVFASFRSAKGKKIFPTQINLGNAHGLGLVCASGFVEHPPSGLWYDQPGATKAVSQEVIGVGIPVHPTAEQTVYFNHIVEPSEMIVLSLEVLPGVFQHMAVGQAHKIGSWTGGTIYSASRNSYGMFTAGFTKGQIEGESNHLFGLSKNASTFLRCDIDSAPLRTPEVLWASGGPNSGDVAAGYTGKMLALPVLNIDCLAAAWLPKIPHYGYLQSQSSTDTGRNVNTLNCISVNLPLAVYVLRDPDGLANFSQCAYVPGVYFISTRNVAPGSAYAINYPESGTLYQAFPQTSRGGAIGYDGISIKQ